MLISDISLIHTLPPTLTHSLPCCFVLLFRAAFTDVTCVEIQELMHLSEITAQEILEAANDLNIVVEEKLDTTAEHAGLTIADIKKLIKTGILICYLLKQNFIVNNSVHCVNINQAVSNYEKYCACINTKHQRKTKFYASHPQPVTQSATLLDPQPDPPEGVNTHPGLCHDDDDGIQGVLVCRNG